MIEKEALTFVSSQTITAGGSDVEGSWQDLRDGHGCTIIGTITNGATGPTVAARMKVQISHNNGTDSYTVLDVPGDTANNGERSFRYDIPRTVMYARVVFEAPTVQDCTVEAIGHNIAQLV